MPFVYNMGIFNNAFTPVLNLPLTMHGLGAILSRSGAT